MKKYRIGQLIKYNTITLKAIRGNQCNDCYFSNLNCDEFPCITTTKSGTTSIIFVKFDYWEYFSEPELYWTVKRKNDKDFNSTRSFALIHEEEAKALCDLLNNL